MVGFALHIVLALLVATGIGFFNGEWLVVSQSARNWLFGSIELLILAVGILSYATHMQCKEEAGPTVSTSEVSSMSGGAWQVVYQQSM